MIDLRAYLQHGVRLRILHGREEGSRNHPKKKPAKRKPKAPKPLLTPDDVIERLRALYGEPEWRPHGDATAELVLTLLSQNTADYNTGRAFSRLLQQYPGLGVGGRCAAR